jgi:hypothetical protein
MSEFAQNRHCNVLMLYQRFIGQRIAEGAPPLGAEAAFAQSLEISPSLWSQIKNNRTIGDKLARQIEQHAQVAPGWLDEEHQVAVQDPREEAFVELCRRVWRGANRAQKIRMRRIIDEFSLQARTSGKHHGP